MHCLTNSRFDKKVGVTQLLVSTGVKALGFFVRGACFSSTIGTQFPALCLYLGSGGSSGDRNRRVGGRGGGCVGYDSILSERGGTVGTPTQ